MSTTKPFAEAAVPKPQTLAQKFEALFLAALIIRTGFRGYIVVDLNPEP